MGFRYIGSKDKLSEIIISEIRTTKKTANHVIDLMAGTGLFSLALRENGFQVSAVDMMTYSFHHLSVHLFLEKAPSYSKVLKHISKVHEHNSTTLFESSNYEKLLSYLNSLKPIKGYFYNQFSPEGVPMGTKKPRQYFTGKNAAKIDAIRLEIRKLKESKLLSQVEHSLLLHDLIMAANDVANIAGTYGHYLSKMIKRAESPILLSPTIFSSLGNVDGHTIMQGYAEDVANKLEGDICYIDPPYIKRQYAANYHILETLAREDEPEAIGESGLRPWRDQYSDFCSKVKIRGAFDKIISKIHCDDFLISYSEDGLIPINELMNFLKKYGTVTKKEIKYKRFKSRVDTNKDAELNEYLLHLRKN
jgi:adenine-specific DNA-methyltransferase